VHGRSGTLAAGRKLASALVASALLVGAIAPGTALAVNTPPTAVRDSVTILEDAGPAVVDVIDNDTDDATPNESLVATQCAMPNLLASDARYGSVVLQGGRECVMTPNADFSGQFVGSYIVSDGSAASLGFVDYYVTAVNDAPSFTKGADVSVAEDSGAASYAGWATDLNKGASNESSQTLTFHVTPANPDLFAAGPAVSAAGALSFTPAANAYGSTSVEIYVTDNGGTGNGGANTSATHTFNITITAENEAPVAVDDEITVAEDSPTAVTAQILGNDTDVDGNDLIVSAVDDSGSIGQVTLDTGVVTYTPDPEWCGADAFDYTVSDGLLDDIGTVLVTVDCVNDEPVAVDDIASGTEDTDVVVAKAALVGNDTDPDGPPLSVAVVGNPVHGTVAISGPDVIFTPAADYCGTASFEYTVSDGDLSDVGLVDITLDCVADDPVAVDDAIQLDEDTPTDFSIATDLLADDSDPDGDTVILDGFAQPANGMVDITGDVLTYTPDENACGADSFTYDIVDGNGGMDTGTVDVTVTCVNDAPEAVDDNGSINAGVTPKLFDVVGNDTDDDMDTLTLESADFQGAGPIVGAGSVAVVAGKVEYTPDPRVQGPIEIDYVVSDGSETDTGTLTITIIPDTTKPTVTAPKITFGTGRVNETAPIKVSWTGSDAGTGIFKYTLQAKVATGPWTTIYTGTGTSFTKGFAFAKTLQFRVSAEDIAGNTSANVLSAVRTIQTYQAPGASGISYGTTAWSSRRTSEASGIGFVFTTRKNNWAKVQVTGYEVIYVAPRTSSSGHVKVFVGTTLLGRYDLYRASTAHGQIIAHKAWTTSAKRTIRIFNDEGGKRTNLDVFVVLR
jgi:hypothetical protein